MISYIKALDFTLRKESQVKKWQVIAAYAGTYFVLPMIILGINQWVFLGGLVLFLLLRSLFIPRFRSAVRSGTKAAVRSLTYLWISISLLISGATGAYTFSQPNTLEQMRQSAVRDLAGPEISTDTALGIATSMYHTLAGLSLAFLIMGSLLLIGGHFLIKRMLRRQTIKDIDPEKVFAQELRTLNDAPLAVKVIAIIYGVFVTIGATASAVSLGFMPFSIAMALNALSWAFFVALFWIAFRGTPLRAPLLVVKTLTVLFVSIDILLIAGLFGNPVMPAGVMERVINLVLSVPLYLVALWYSFMYLPARQKSDEDKELFV